MQCIPHKARALKTHYCYLTFGIKVLLIILIKAIVQINQRQIRQWPGGGLGPDPHGPCPVRALSPTGPTRMQVTSHPPSRAGSNTAMAHQGPPERSGCHSSSGGQHSTDPGSKRQCTHHRRDSSPGSCPRTLEGEGKCALGCLAVPESSISQV